MLQPPVRGRGADRTTLPWYATPLIALLFAGFTSDTDSTRYPHSGMAPSGPAAATPFFSGVFLGDQASRPERIESALREFGRAVGSRPALVKTFFTLEDDFSRRGWAGRVLRRVHSAGATNYVALDLRWTGAPQTNLLEAIAAGAADDAIRRAARQLREIDGPVLLEPAWEMNGNWSYPWQGEANGKNEQAPARFGAAWRRLVDLFRDELGSNVRWVFSPNVGNPVAGAAGEDHWNWYGNYYPGDAWVDYVGAHGFNAPSLWRAPYRDFRTLFDGEETGRMLSDLAARYPDKPIIIGEFASEESPGRDKGEWIRSAYRFLQSHPRVVGAVWFNMKKESDWQVDSSAAALVAFRDAMRGPRVTSTFDETFHRAPTRSAAP